MRELAKTVPDHVVEACLSFRFVLNHLSSFMVFLKSLETISKLILYSEYTGEIALDLIGLGYRLCHSATAGP